VSLTLLVGGARSGKSRLAVRLAREQGGPVVFVATGEAGDEEMARRIARHREERPSDWLTVEEPVRLLEALASTPAGTTVVLDCLSFWVANLLDARTAEEIEAEATRAAAVAAARTTIAVTNEVGLGVVPPTASGRAYRDVLGRVNAIWAEVAVEAYFVVAGRVLPLEKPGA
jgi:adenosyl cobinamide kinase/adenosyl cobinamide phosphate guanylyltransferase